MAEDPNDPLNTPPPPPPIGTHGEMPSRPPAPSPLDQSIMQDKSAQEDASSSVSPDLSIKKSSNKPSDKPAARFKSFIGGIDQKEVPHHFKRNSIILAALVAALFFGFIFRGFFSGGKPKMPPNAVGGVIRNTDIKGSVPRCGTVPKGNGCIMFLMNPHSQDREAKFFFETVAEMAGVYKYVVETSNPNYAHTIIRPGYIGVFYIMPMK